MHPGCPDFDLCSECEALPIPVHPLNHPMLKLRTSDTVIPTVYRVGEAQTIDDPAGQKSPPVCGEPRSPTLLPPSPLVTPIKSPELRPVVVSGQATNVTAEDQIPFAEEFLSPLGSPASKVLGVAPTSNTIAPSNLLVDVADPPGSSPSGRLALDIYHQLWPRVNQEMIHLNAMEAGDPAVNSVEEAVTEPVDPESLVTEESLPGSPVTSSVYQASERHGTCPVSPVPGTKSIVDGYRTPSSMPSNVQESHCVTQQSPVGDQQEIVGTNSPQKSCLDSALVGDTNVSDGQIFPPGAEFVKGWHMMNNGGLPWPTTTEVQFVAGEMFTPVCSATLSAKVGVVHPGQDLDIWTGDLKVCAHPRSNRVHTPDFC
jgi:next-to-BRCA1 protein 1